VRPSIQHFLDGIIGAAALVHNARLDNLAANHLGRALYSDLFATTLGLLGSWAATEQANLARPSGSSM
jgi:hypothetical protein